MKFLIKRKNSFYKLLNLFTLLALVFNMSVMGVFFVSTPEVQALQPGLCEADVDVVLIMDRSGSMGYEFKCVWWDNSEWVTDYFFDEGENNENL